MSKADVKKANIDNELIKKTLHNLRPRPCMMTGDCAKKDKEKSAADKVKEEQAAEKKKQLFEEMEAENAKKRKDDEENVKLKEDRRLDEEIARMKKDVRDEFAVKMEGMADRER